MKTYRMVEIIVGEVEEDAEAIGGTMVVVKVIAKKKTCNPL